MAGDSAEELRRSFFGEQLTPLPRGPGHVLLVGATGVVGRAAVETFNAVGGWKVTAVSRRRPDYPLGAAEHLSLDLTDRASCEAALAPLVDVTHVVFSALFEMPGDLVRGWQEEEQQRTNDEMLRNLLDPILSHARGFQHLSLMQGAKARSPPHHHATAF